MEQPIHDDLHHWCSESLREGILKSRYQYLRFCGHPIALKILTGKLSGRRRGEPATLRAQRGPYRWLIGLDDACERYQLSMEEFLNWERLVNTHGLRGLRATRLQTYREVEPVDAPPAVLSTHEAARMLGKSDI